MCAQWVTSIPGMPELWAGARPGLAWLGACETCPRPASRRRAVRGPLALLPTSLPGTPAPCVCVSDHVVITPVMPTCSSLPASGTFAVDPGVGACLLTSPEVIRRVVTHSAPASTCPCSRPEPPSLQRGEGTGQPVLGAWVLLALGPRLWLPSGQWVAAPTSGSPLEACSCSSPATHTDPGKRQFSSGMRFPHHPCCGGSA